MHLILVGLNHKSAPVEIRERVAIPGERLPLALEVLRRDFGFQEGMILSTCNRVEVIAANGDHSSRAVESLKLFLHRFHSLDPPSLEQYLYTLRYSNLVHHVFRVASSLDSQVVGEPQILAQFKNAYLVAQKAGNAGALLDTLIPRAIFVAKRVRTQTRIGNSAVSISSAAVELAKKIFGELQEKSVLLLGAGKMCELAAERLISSGVSRLFVANRTSARAGDLAARIKATPVPFSEMDHYLSRSDIVIVSTGADSFLLQRKQIEEVVRARKYAPLFVIDISVPRNVDPEVNEIENVFLYDIDDLEAVVDSNREERNRAALQAESIIQQEVENFRRQFENRKIGPIIRSLRERIEEMCLMELQKDRARLSDEEYEKLEKVLRKTAHRLAHPLIQKVKHLERDPGGESGEIAVIRKLFDLDKD